MRTSDNALSGTQQGGPAVNPVDHLEVALSHLDKSDLGAARSSLKRLMASHQHYQLSKLLNALADTLEAELDQRNGLPMTPPPTRGCFGTRRSSPHSEPGQGVAPWPPGPVPKGRARGR
jgi:hypothetical protein